MSLKTKPRLVKKSQLDRRVALLLGERIEDVSLITATFLDSIGVELSSLKDVQLDGLGTVHVAVRQGPGVVREGRPDTDWQTKYHVTFKKSRGLRRLLAEKNGELKETIMEKLGVDESQADNEKLASGGCPECGAKVERHGNVLSCPNHGTEPFEKKTK